MGVDFEVPIIHRANSGRALRRTASVSVCVCVGVCVCACLCVPACVRVHVCVLVCV